MLTGSSLGGLQERAKGEMVPYALPLNGPFFLQFTIKLLLLVEGVRDLVALHIMVYGNHVSHQ